MQTLFTNINIQVNDKIYLKAPESSKLGKQIISGSIQLLYELGFDAFTFQKLAKEIGSTEASVYRYFENKHKLLLYLFAWHWAWFDFRLSFKIANIASPQQRLKMAIDLITRDPENDLRIDYIDEVKLNHIIIAESSKAYLHKSVDEVNKDGVYLDYKQFVGRISDIVLEIKPDYKYPHMLISTIIEGVHHQRYFAAHLPRLTDVVEGEDSIAKFYEEIVFKAIGTD